MRDVLADLPEKVRLNALSRGNIGEAWLAGLSAQVTEYERRWGIRVGQVASGGTEGFVAEATLEDGREAILKIVMSGTDSNRQELRTLRAANGRGYATLLRADEESNVLLLEKLGHQLHALGLPEEDMLAHICATLTEAWMPCEPEGPRFITGAERADEFAGVITQLWEALGKSCASRTVEMALAFAERRSQAFDPARSVLVHGDAHEWNTLQVPGSATRFKLVDPDGAFAENAFDLAIPMREWPDGVPDAPLAHLRRRCALLARLTNVAPQPIWEWSLLQLVWNGLLLKEIGFEAPAATEFAMADALASGGVNFVP